MHFVAVKTEAQQALGMLFRTRDLLVRQRTQTINALRGHLAEYGVVAPQGRTRIGELAGVLEDGDSGLPETVVELGWLLLGRIDELDAKIDGLEGKLRAGAREDEETARLMTIPGIGPITPPRWHCRRSPRRWRASGAGPTSRLGSASCRGSTPRAASRGWAGYRRWASGVPEARIPAGNRLTTYRTARSAFPAVGRGRAPSCRDCGKTGMDWRESGRNADPLRPTLLPPTAMLTRWPPRPPYSASSPLSSKTGTGRTMASP